jgi:rhodanese-related sulfurtransferase
MPANTISPGAAFEFSRRGDTLVQPPESAPEIDPASACASGRAHGGAAAQPRIIDVRTPAEFATVHVAGAQLIPLDRLDPGEFMKAGDGDADAPLYFICRSGGRAAIACARFQAAGFRNVFTIEGGTLAWEQAGLPVVRGTGRVIALERQVRIAAGSLVVVGVLLGVTVHPGFLGVAAFVGAGLVFAGITDWCGMGMMLARLPWNRGR